MFSIFASNRGPRQRSGDRDVLRRTRRRHLAVENLEPRMVLATVYLDFDNGGLTRINEAVLRANGDSTPDPATECETASPIACFTQLDLDGGSGLDYTGDGVQDPGIKELVTGRLQVIFGLLPFSHELAFQTTQPPSGSLYTEADFNTTGQPGNYGWDPSQDSFNTKPNSNTTVETVLVFPDAFDWFLRPNLCPSTPGAAGCAFDYRYPNARTAQFIELTNALAGVAAHELGHSFGLGHAFAYGDPAAAKAEPEGSPNAGKILNTYGGQNNFVMASGDTFAPDSLLAIRLPTFSEFSAATLRYTPGVASSPHGPQDETSAKSGVTLNPVQPGVLAGYVKGATLNGSTETDVYPVSLAIGDVLSVTVQGFTSSYSNSAWVTFDVIDKDTLDVIYAAPNGGSINILVSATTFNSGSDDDLQQWDPMFANLPITNARNYAVKVKGGNNIPIDHEGNYDLIISVRKQVDSGKLYVYGSDGVDTVNLSVSGSDIVATVNGTEEARQPLSLISEVVVKVNGGNDQLTLGAGVNKPIRVFGGKGNDTLNGGEANDTLEGGFGDDSLAGGPGDDYYVYDSRQDVNVDFGTDTIVESSGNGTGDTIDLSKAAIWGMGAFIDLKATSTTIVIGSTSKPYLKLTALNAQEVENIIGTEEDDSLWGNDLANWIDGRGGNDTIYGHGGSDILGGGAGSDVLVGHADVDYYLAQDGEVDALDVDAEDNIINSDPNDIIY